MNEQALLATVGSVLLVYCAVVGTACVYVHSRVDWRSTQMGRHVMWFMLALALTYDLGVVRIFFGDSDWFSLLRLVVFIALPVVTTQRLWLLIKAQRDTRKERRDDFA